MSQIQIGVPGSQLPSRDVTRLGRTAEADGFDSVWWADRLMGWLPAGPHALLDPVAVMAATAGATQRTLLGTAVMDPLRRHPAQLAQTALSLQHLAGGRLRLGLGAGEAAGTLPYGLSHHRPVARLTEALEVLRLLWSTDQPLSFDGEFYELDRALCGLSGRVEPPPVWLAAHGPRTLRLTGTHADGWLPTGHGPRAYAEGLERVRSAAVDGDRDPAAIEPGVFVWMVAADSRARARSLLREPSLRALGLLLPQGALETTPLPDGPWTTLIPSHGDMLELAAGVDADELATVLPHGSPDDIAEDLAAYVDAGARHLVIADMSAVAEADNGLDLDPWGTLVAIRDALRTSHPMAQPT